VPLDEGIICSNGRFRYLDGNTGRESSQERLIQPLYDEGKHRDWVIPLVQKLVGENKQVVVFRETTGETRHGADYLAQSLGLPPATEALSDLPTGDPSQSTLHWRQLLARGVAFHNSHLRRDERRVIEEHFCKRENAASRHRRDYDPCDGRQYAGLGCLSDPRGHRWAVAAEAKSR
jgi:helicase